MDVDVCGRGVEHESGAEVPPSLAGRLQMLAGHGHGSHMSSLMLELCVDQCILGYECASDKNVTVGKPAAAMIGSIYPQWYHVLCVPIL